LAEDSWTSLKTTTIGEPLSSPFPRAGLQKAPKLFPFKPGDYSPLLFEGFIAQTLKAYRELGRLECDQISYWSAGKDSVEVDFVVQQGRELIGIEAKSGTDPEKKWFAGLSALKDSVKLKRSILVYAGKRKYKHDSGTEVLPVQDFMREIESL